MPRTPAPSLRRAPVWALSALAAAVAAQTPPPPNALPQGAQVQAGSAVLQQAGNVLTVRQASDRLVTDWQRFDIGVDAAVRFVQPGRGSIALNRVLAQEPSAVFGQLQANGQVFLINPSGVLFGATARVDVGGLVASSLALSDADFLAGRMHFRGQDAAGAVRNEGRITAAEGGYVAFIAPQVANLGQIVAPQGDVVLAAGQGAQLDFHGDRLLSFTLDQGTLAALVDQQGLVQAEGGRVLLTARAADAARRAVVHQGGLLDAGSLVARGGRIVLEADEITLAAGSRTEARGVTGGGQVLAGGGWGGSGPWRAARSVTLATGAVVDASASGAGNGGEVVLWSDIADAASHTQVDGTILARGAAGGGGGRIETSGHRLDVSGRVDAGPGGLWLLDPVNITITTSGSSVPPGGGSYGTAGNVTASSIATALAGGNSVVLDTSAAGASQGDITLATDLATGAMAADATLTLKANRNIVINAGADIDATSGGNTHKLNLVLWADQDGSGGGAIQLGASGATTTSISTNGGGLWMGGGSGSTSWTPFAGAGALTVGNGAAIGNDASLTGWGLASYGTSITTAGGHVFGRGRSEKNSGTSDVALGVSLQGSSISSGAGDITLQGEVANTSGTTVDITLGLTAHSGSTLASTSGNIALTGTLDASTRAARGAGTWLGTQLGAVAATGDVGITSTSGTIQITGSGADAAGTGFRHGLMLRNQFAGDDIVVRSTGGAITLEGQASYRTAIDVTTGLQFQNDTASGTIQVVSQTGAITLRGGNTQDANVNENDLRFQLADAAGGLRIGYDGSSAYSGNILIEADALYQSQQAGAGSLVVQGSGTLTIRPAGSAFTQLRAGASGTISFDDDWALGSALSGLTIGKAGNTAALTLSSPLTVAGPVQLLAGDITLNAALTGSGELRLQAGGDIVQGAGVAVSTQGGSAIYHADSDGSGAGMVYLKSGASLLTAGGHIWIGGGSGSASWNGLSVGDGFAGGGTVIPKAELLTTLGDDFKNGITLYNASLDSGGGDIALAGRSGSGSDVYGYIGVYLGFGAQITSGAGNIGIQGQASGGTSSTSTGWHYGALLLPTGNDGSSQGTVAVDSTSGSIQIAASAQHDQAANHSAGLALFTQGAAGTARIRSTSGDITLSGQNLNAGNPSYGGILVTGSGSELVVSQTGDIRLEGSSANSAVVGLNLGSGRIGGDGVSAYSGDVTLVTDGLTLDSSALLQSSGTLTLAPASAGTTLGLAGASGDLALPATAFGSSFVDGFAAIVIGRADGTGALSVGSATALDPLTLRNGSGGVAVSGSFTAQQGLAVETSAGLGGSGNLVLGTGQALNVTQAGDSVYSGVVSGSGATLAKAGAGRLTLAADHGHTGSTTVSAGTLQLGNGGASGSVAGAIAVDAALVLDRSDESTIAGVISGSGTLAMNGSGSIELSAANTYAGGTTINAGRLFGGAGSGLRTAFGSGSITVRSGATLWLDRATLDNNLVLDGGQLLGSNGFGELLRGTVSVSSASSIDAYFNITFSGAVSGSGLLTLANTLRDEGELRITGTDTRSGGTLLTAGVLNIGAGGSSGSVAGAITTTARGGVVFQRSDDLVHSGAITGPGSVTQAGSGTLTLGNAAAHTGATLISAGSLVWASDAPVFGTSGFSGAGRLVVQPAGASFGSTFDLSTLPALASDLGGLQVGSASNAAGLSLAGALSITGDITLLGGTVTLASGAGLATSNGHITVSAARFVNQAGASVFSAGGSGRRWQVWSRNGDPFDAGTGDVRGGLAFDYKQYAASHGSSTVLGSGNGLLYTFAPTLTATLSGVGKVYDGSATVVVDGSHFGASGALDGDAVLLATPGSASFTGAGAQNAGTGKSVQATGVSLTGVSNGSATVYGYGLASGTASGSDGTITPAALTLSGTRVYDGSTAMAGSTLTATGVNGESFAVTGSGAGGNLASRQVQTGQALASVTGLSLGSSGNGGLAGNYQALSVTGSSVSVTARPLTVSGITAADKVYDGGTAASISAAGVIFGGLVAGDAVAVSSSGSFGDKNVGTGKTVTLSNSFSGADLGNYTITDQTGTTASIAPKALTVSGISAADKVYDGGTAASVSTLGVVFGGLVTGDVVGVSGSGSFGDKNVGAGKTVVLSNSYSGADLGNYAITDQTGTTASITPKALTVSGIVAADKVYDGSTAASVSTAGVIFGGLVAGDLLSVGSSGGFGDKNVGAGKPVALSNVFGGADLGNYTITDQTGTTASITPKALTVSGITAADKVYDGGTAASVSTLGAVFGGLVAGDVVGVSSSGSFGDKNVGAGKPVALSNVFGGADLGNYAITDQTGTTASIAPKALTVSGIVAADKVYDGAVAASISTAGVIFGGLVAGDLLSVGSTGSFGDKNVGAGKPVALSNVFGGADLGNYAITDQTGTTASITPKALTVSGIVAADKVYDGSTAASVSTAGVIFGGLVAGDLVSAGSTGGFGDKNVGAGKTVVLSNSYSGADLGNYTITDQTGTTASITPKALTVSGITAADKVYDGAVAASISTAGVIFGGLVAGDLLSVGSTGGFGDKNVGAGKTVVLSNSYSGADLGNYAITDQASTTASITPKALTVSGIVAADKVYDGATAASISTAGVIFGGLVAGDLLGVGSTGSFGDKNAATGKTVALNNSYSGADLGNYTITDQASTTASITPKVLTVGGITAADKVYDGGAAASISTAGVTFGGLVAGDVLGIASSGSFADKHAGTGKTVTLANSYTGADLGNYTITDQASATASIAPRPLNLAFDGIDKVYDGQLGASVTLRDDRIAGDQLALRADAVFDDRHVGSGKTVQVRSVQIDGTDAGNYTLAAGPVSTRASITQRASATWIGTPGGDWMDASQWADGALPDLANVAQVLLPDGASPRLAGGSVQLTALQGGGATLLQSGGLLTTGSALLGGLQQTGGRWVVDGDAQIGSAQAALLLGDLQVGGALALVAPDGRITMAPGGLLQAAGPVAITAGRADLVVGGPLQLSAIDIAGDLRLRSDAALGLGAGRVGGGLDGQGMGDITQTGALTVIAGLKLDAGPGAVDLAHPDNRFTGPVVIAGAGGVHVVGARPDGLPAVTDASTAALAVLPPVATPAVAPLTVLVGSGAGSASVLARAPLDPEPGVADLLGTGFDLEWTGDALHIRARGTAALAASDRARLVQRALRVALQRWGLAPERIAAVHLLP